MWTRWLLLACCAALLLGFWTEGIQAQLAGNSQTSDEAVHLAAGHRDLLKRSRINPEHPPIAKLVAAIPVALSSYMLPEDVAGGTEEQLADTAAELEDPSAQWGYGLAYLYETPLNYGTDMLYLGRTALAVLTTFLLLVGLSWIIGWSPAAAVVTMGILLTDPTLMAHSALITNDGLLTAFAMLCILGWMSWLEKPGADRALMWGAYLSLALLTKFSALMLPPAMLACAVGWKLCGGALPSRGRAAWHLGLGAAMAIGPMFAFYEGGPLGYLEAYSTLQSSWAVYLLGTLSSEGWLHYFAVALWAKLPPGTLLLMLLLPLAIWRGPRLSPREGALLATAAVLFALPSVRKINIGVRHILPLLPILAALVGLRASRLWTAYPPQRRALVGGVSLLLLLNLWGLPRWWGHGISYFSPLTVGDNGADWLGDSNLDWGQGLAPLAVELEAHGSPPIILGAFGNTPPEPWGIRAWQPLPASGHLKPAPRRVLPSEQTPELLAISEMTRLGVYFPPELRDLYAWLDDYEPIARPGGSYRLYDITDDHRAWTELHRLYVRVGWTELAELWAARIADRANIERPGPDSTRDGPPPEE